MHEFDDNVAVFATTIASITTGIVQFQAFGTGAKGGKTRMMGLPDG